MRIHSKEAVARVTNAISARTPIALVRFLEGEARLLHATPGDQEHIRMACKKLRRQTGVMFKPNDMFDVRNLVLHALDNADVAAILGNHKFTEEHMMWVKRVEAIYAERSQYRTRPTFVTEGMVNRNLLAALPTLVNGHNFITAITCRNVRPMLESYGVKNVRVFQIPSQFVKRSIDDEYEARLHETKIWPHAIKEIEHAMTVREPGEVFLIGAGLFGKHLCIQIRDLGGIALDLGSAMDDMVGKPTRGPAWEKHLQEAESNSE